MTAKFRKPHTQFVINQDTQQKLIDLDTAPFRDLLAIMLSAMPTGEVLAYWAARHPDRWAQSVMNISRCAGLITKEPTPPQGGVTVNLHLMSDSQVHALIHQQAEQLLQLGIKLPVIEAERVVAHIEQGVANAK